MPLCRIVALSGERTKTAGADVDQQLFIVSDGMGGQGAGDVASQLVVDLLPNRIARACPADRDVRDSAVQEAVVDVIRCLSAEVYEESQGQSSIEGLGATVVVILIRDAAALVANLGDSRCYHLHDAQLVRVSADHTVAQHLVSAGEISAADLAAHPAAGRLTQYVGMAPPTNPHLAVFELDEHDRLLLCTDGLTHTVSDDDIRGQLHDAPDVAAACRSFVDSSHSAGGEDNVTVLVIEVNSDDHQSRTASLKVDEQSC